MPGGRSHNWTVIDSGDVFKPPLNFFSLLGWNVNLYLVIVLQLKQSRISRAYKAELPSKLLNSRILIVLGDYRSWAVLEVDMLWWYSFQSLFNCSDGNHTIIMFKVINKIEWISRWSVWSQETPGATLPLLWRGCPPLLMFPLSTDRRDKW